MKKAEAYLNILRLHKKTCHYAKHDPEVALALSRKTTEAICKFVYSTRISDKPNSMMLEKLLDKFSTERTIPRKILTPMRTIQSYGNFGGHDQEDEYGEIDQEYAVPSISALKTVMKWFRDENRNLEWALKTSVHHVNLSKRAITILDNVCLTSLADLCQKTEAELLKYRGLGKSILGEIKSVLETHGLDLGLTFDPKLLNNP